MEHLGMWARWGGLAFLQGPPARTGKSEMNHGDSAGPGGWKTWLAGRPVAGAGWVWLGGPGAGPMGGGGSFPNPFSTPWGTALQGASWDSGFRRGGWRICALWWAFYYTKTLRCWAFQTCLLPIVPDGWRGGFLAVRGLWAQDGGGRRSRWTIAVKRGGCFAGPLPVGGPFAPASNKTRLTDAWAWGDVFAGPDVANQAAASNLHSRRTPSMGPRESPVLRSPLQSWARARGGRGAESGTRRADRDQEGKQGRAARRQGAGLDCGLKLDRILAKESPRVEWGTAGPREGEGVS